LAHSGERSILDGLKPFQKREGLFNCFDMRGIEPGERSHIPLAECEQM
jgi:hypothetical protein